MGLGSVSHPKPSQEQSRIWWRDPLFVSKSCCHFTAEPLFLASSSMVTPQDFSGKIEMQVIFFLSLLKIVILWHNRVSRGSDKKTVTLRHVTWRGEASVHPRHATLVKGKYFSVLGSIPADFSGQILSDPGASWPWHNLTPGTFVGWVWGYWWLPISALLVVIFQFKVLPRGP